VKTFIAVRAQGEESWSYPHVGRYRTYAGSIRSARDWFVDGSGVELQDGDSVVLVEYEADVTRRVETYRVCTKPTLVPA
jgi:hypothetical protein